MSAMSDPSSASTAWPAARPAGISPIQHPAWEEARNAVLDLAAAGPVTAVIVGEAGTGKTWLLRELASSLGDHGFPTMMLMQGDLPMALSSGAALLVDEAALMSAAMRAKLSAQQHGVVVLAATEWVAAESDPGSPGPVIIPMRRLDPAEAAEVAAEWLHRSGLPSSSVDPAGLSRLTAQSGGNIGTLVQSLNAAAAAWRQPRIAPAPAPAPVKAPVKAPVAPPITAVEPRVPPPIAATIPRRRSVYRPVLAGSAIAALIALGWALKPVSVSRVAPLASTDTGQRPQATVALADATQAAPPAPVALGPTAESAAPALPAPVEPIDPAASSLPLVRPVEPSASAAVTPAQPAEPATVRRAEPAASAAVTPVQPAEPAASATVTPVRPIESAASMSAAPVPSEEPAASATATTVSPAEPAASASVQPARPAELPAMQAAEPAEPPQTAVADAAAPAPATFAAAPLPPPRDAETPVPAVATAAVPVQPKTPAPSLAALPPQSEESATPTQASDATASAPAVASALPPVLLRSSAPSLIAALAAPAALPTEPTQTLSSGTGGQGLVLIVQRGDTLQSLYDSVYRYRNAPPFATVVAANPRPLKPGAIVVFPEPPGGWKRAQR